MTPASTPLPEQDRQFEDRAWWQHYDTCLLQGYTRAHSAYAADIVTYGRVVNNPKPARSK